MTTATASVTTTTEGSTTGSAVRQVGRPRDPRVDEAIVGATLQLLADGGYTSLTMEAVAALAGVGKATLYRRYTGKEQLVIDAVATMSEPPEVLQGATVREELVGRLEAIRRTSDSSLAGKIFPRLISASADNPELMRNYRRQVLEPRRGAFAAALRRGVDEGLVRADVDLDYAIDLLVGPMAYRNLIRTEPPPGPELAARIVDDVLLALAPHSPHPGARPGTHDLENP
jgi:AcrR family transcriptional regulator